MEKTKTNNFSLRSFLLRTMIDPVLWYTVLVMTALMFHYRDHEKVDNHGYILALGCGAATFVIGWLLFRIFDFMQKRHLLGFLLYSAVGVCFAYAFRTAINWGQEDYPITWGLWFLTPQDSVDYNFMFTMAFYILFTAFMCSVIYYFTRVRYRIFMNFLIFIIPFAIYGKEYEKMPTLFIILLAVGYILLMVYYRQLKDNEDTLFVSRRRSWKTIAVYAVLFASVAALFPKPAIEADRTTLETLINADILTDKLNNMLNVFRDTSDGQRFRGNIRTVNIYEASSADDLHLKMGTYSTYYFDNDSWKPDDIDLYYRQKTTDNNIAIGSPMGLADAFLEAASLDSEYAEKYGLTKYLKDGLDVPEQRTVSIYTVLGSSGLSNAYDMAPVPQNAVRMSACSKRGTIATLSGGTVSSVGSNFDNSELFIFEYSADTFLNSEKNMEFVNNLAKYDYEQLLTDTEEVFESSKTDEELDSDDAYGYFRNDYLYYDKYCDLLLEYGDNKRIKELADQLTDGIDNDFEKARLLERYFYNNNYVYNLGYKKKKGENAEDFIFETKTGVCYEYATAMVLLARAAGIPARYCAGYNMNQRANGIINDNTNYIVTTKDAHGYPQLYIKGYGWMDFEPTITDANIRKGSKTATDMLSRAGLIILIGGLIVLLFVLVYPWLSHKVFIFMSGRRSPEAVIKAAIQRICRIYDIENVNTSSEAASIVRSTSGADISDAVEVFDRAFYGEEKLGESDRETAVRAYICAYNAYKETKKGRGITNRIT